MDFFRNGFEFLREVGGLEAGVEGLEVAGLDEVVDRPVPALVIGDQFRDATKLMVGPITLGFAGLDGPADGSEEVFPARVADGLPQVAGEPELDFRFVGVLLCQLVELVAHCFGSGRVSCLGFDLVQIARVEVGLTVTIWA